MMAQPYRKPCPDNWSEFLDAEAHRRQRYRRLLDDLCAIQSVATGNPFAALLDSSREAIERAMRSVWQDPLLLPPGRYYVIMGRWTVTSDESHRFEYHEGIAVKHPPTVLGHPIWTHISQPVTVYAARELGPLPFRDTTDAPNGPASP